MQGQHDVGFDACVIRVLAAQNCAVERKSRQLAQATLQEQSDLGVSTLNRQADLVAFQASARVAEAIVGGSKLQSRRSRDAVDLRQRVLDALAVIEEPVELCNACRL